MKKTLYLLALVAVMLTLTAIPAFADGAASIIAAPDKATANAGDEVTYTVSVSNPTGQGIAGLTMTASLPEGIEYVSSTVNRDNFQLVGYNAEAGAYNGTGTAAIEGVTAPSFQLMTITGKVLDTATGDKALAVSVSELYDGDINDIPSAVSSSPVAITAPAQPTEPTEPTEPNEPVETTQPAEPAEPAEQEQPAENEQPAQEQPSQPTQSNSGAKKDSVPKTGEADHTTILLSVILVGVVGTVYFGKKKHAQKG